MSQDKKLYVLVRQDLSPSYQAVQAGHAVAEWLLQDSQTWRNQTLIYLGVKNENKLLDWEYLLKSKDIKYAAFCEPDINNQMTAIATVCDSKIFKKLRLA